VQCKEDRVLVLRTNGSPACVSEKTAERTGWKILKTEFIHTEKLVTIPEPTITPEQVTPTIVILDQSSDVEFVDDGREIFRSKLQGMAPPFNAYNLVIGGMNTNNFKNDGHGFITTTLTPHEKYSLNLGGVFYLEDWLPDYIPDGYKLLYSNTQVQKSGSVTLNHRFVPTSFVLTPDITNYDLTMSKGFVISVEKYVNIEIPSIENSIKQSKELFEKSSGNVGGYRDIYRDGKLVSAYAGSNDYNSYQSVISFNFNEDIIVILRSDYHTLDELIPIYESIGN